jgi:hypothetical protein
MIFSISLFYWAFPDPLYAAASTSSAMQTPENAEEDSDDPVPAAEGATPME